MNETVREWVAKAEGDNAAAGRELRAPDSPNFDAVGFHAQQCVDKLMKALLIHVGVRPPKTHDLVSLDRLLAQSYPGWSSQAEGLRFLTHASLAFRYPGESTSREEATESYNIATRMREKLQTLLSR